MKKLFVIILAVMMLIGITASPTQAVIMQSPDARVKTAVWTSTTGIYAGSGLTTGYTPTAGSALVAGNRIVGYQVTGSSNPQVGLYDAPTTDTSSSLANSQLFDEPACASNMGQLVWYPAPKTLTYGLQVIRNASTTTIVIFYE